MWDVFISHASEDKEAIARPLADELARRGFRVWYDDFTLEIGDSLRRSIDKGLRESRYGVVILSPGFFAKEWPQRELDGLTARESNGVKVILPIWHQLTREKVANYSPVLADRLGVDTSQGIAAVVNALEKVLSNPNPVSLFGYNVDRLTISKYQEAESKRSRQQWRTLTHVTYPVLSDSEQSRGLFAMELAQSLHATFADTGFQRFTSLLHVAVRNTPGGKIFAYNFDCHQARFCETLRQRCLKMYTSIMNAKESGTSEAKSQIREEMARELLLFRQTWRTDVSIEFSSELSPLEIIYDPDTFSISIHSSDLSYDPAHYPNRITTTSELLRFVASAARLHIGYVSDIGWFLENYPLTKIMVEILDNRNICMDAIRMNVNDCEEWDYDNPEFDAEIGRFQRS